MILLRDYANLTERELLTKWWKNRVKVVVKDDHGETLETDSYVLMVNWYGLSIHRAYNKIPYSIQEIFQAKVWNDKTIQRPINWFLQNQLMPLIDDPVETDRIKQMIYEWQIKLNNFLHFFGQGAEISALGYDILDVMDHPLMKSIKERIHSLEITIDEGEAEFKSLILEHEDFDSNTFALLARTGSVSVNQGFQTVIIRGSVFDLNNQILPNPVEASFADGLVNLADALGESKAAGKSLISNGRALEDSEWFHRKLHIVTSVVTDLHHQTDCGTTFTVPIKVLSRDMLSAMKGKYIVEEGKLVLLTDQTIKRYHKGDVLNMRSVKGCLTHKPGEPCGVCYGKMKASIPYNVIMMKSANPGMYSATAIAERIGQALLSTKHFMRHTQTIPFFVKPTDADVISSDTNYIFLNKEMCRKGTKVILDGLIGSELSDFRNLESLDEINFDQLRTFPSVAFEYETEDPMTEGIAITQRNITTSVSSRSARMSREFIEYAISKGWEKDKKLITVDLSDYRSEDPLFFLPYVHEDLDQYRRQIEGFVSFSNRNNAWKQREITPEIFGEVLGEMWSLVNRKFAGINIIHSEIILYSLLTRDPFNGLYRIPRGDEPQYFSAFTHCINNRGIGTLAIYQKQNQILESPETYDIKERQGGAFECYLAPAVL